jgi:hypothetical protein
MLLQFMEWGGWRGGETQSTFQLLIRRREFFHKLVNPAAKIIHLIAKFVHPVVQRLFLCSPAQECAHGVSREI